MNKISTILMSLIYRGLFMVIHVKTDRKIPLFFIYNSREIFVQDLFSLLKLGPFFGNRKTFQNGFFFFSVEGNVKLL